MDDSFSYENGGFPLIRKRRNRMRNFSRKITEETNINVNNLILPLFVTEGSYENTPILSMPGVIRHSISSLITEAKEAFNLGIPAIALFPFIDTKLKDEDGSLCTNENNIICRAVKAIKQECPNLGVICDVALDPYTSHGHDGVIRNGEVDNDETIKILCEQSIVQARAGCDIIAPSDMMDGRIKRIRETLDKKSFLNTQIMAYSAKYNSVYYSPFREALGSEKIDLLEGKKSYQMNPANTSEAMSEISLDIKEGADIILIKPALSYLDIIYRARKIFDVPIFAYQVSGEYSMIKISSMNNLIDENRAIFESLISIRRSGAYSIITYFAKDVAQMIKNNKFNNY